MQRPTPSRPSPAANAARSLLSLARMGGPGPRFGRLSRRLGGLPPGFRWLSPGFRASWKVLLVLLGLLTLGMVSPTAAEPHRVVALGDSITYGYPDPATGWVQRLGIDNAGVPGERTDQMLRRLGAVLAARPRLVLVMGGTNDLVQQVPQATIVANLRQIVRRLRASDTPTVLLTIAPPSQPSWVAPIDALNAAIRGLAAAEGVRLIDIHSALAGPSGTFLPGFSTDGVHPTPAGYAALADAVRAALTNDIR